MARYIDIEPIEKATKERRFEAITLALIKEQKTADVRENIHGMWIVDEDGNVECSVCGHHGVGDLYCERCGAKMDEGTTEEDWYSDEWRDEWDERREDE